MTGDGAGTVGLLQAVRAVALDDALIAVALADAGHVHAIALGEQFARQLVADLELGAVLQSELFQNLLELGDTGLLLVAGLGLGELTLGDGVEAELHRLVPVLLGGLLLHHGAGARLNDGHGKGVSGFVEDLGHADLLADDCLFH